MNRSIQEIQCKRNSTEEPKKSCIIIALNFVSVFSFIGTVRFKHSQIFLVFLGKRSFTCAMRQTCNTQPLDNTAALR